jgi:hypothetical protein
MGQQRLHPLQELELGWLGPDDPAEVQVRTIAELERAVSAPRRAPAEGWSATEILAHFADVELIVGYRYRRALTEDEPTIDAFDPDSRAAALAYGERAPQSSFEMFRGLRRANLELWRGASPASRARAGVHPERGRESFDLMFRMTAGHDRIHLAQLREALGMRP